MKTNAIRNICIAGSILLLIALASCTQEQTARASRLGATAITVAQLGGAIDKEQADFARKAGKLVLTASDETLSHEQRLAVISTAALDFAEESGAVTKEEAAALREMGEVPLPEPVLLPPVTAQK